MQGLRQERQQAPRRELLERTPQLRVQEAEASRGGREEEEVVMEQEIIEVLKALASGVPGYYEMVVSDYVARYTLLGIGHFLGMLGLLFLTWKLGQNAVAFTKVQDQEADQW